MFCTYGVLWSFRAEMKKKFMLSKQKLIIIRNWTGICNVIEWNEWMTSNEDYVHCNQDQMGDLGIKSPPPPPQNEILLHWNCCQSNINVLIVVNYWWGGIINRCKTKKRTTAPGDMRVSDLILFKSSTDRSGSLPLISSTGLIRTVILPRSLSESWANSTKWKSISDDN